MLAQIQQQLAKAKLVYNSKKDTYTVVVAFNVYERDKDDNWIFPVRKKCNFVSGELNYETLERDKQRVIAQAKNLLRTNNIMFV
jgi:hypothetical protein